jgi:hypothetical protein
MSTETIRIDGRIYVTHDCWTFGDYGGAGSIGLSNIRYIVAQCEGRVIECGANTLRHISEGCPYGLGAKELAEIRAERPWAIRTYGDYGSQRVWVRKAIAMRLSSHGFQGDTWIERMEGYPSLDEDGSSQIEMEWESEAWKSWLKHDLLITLSDDLQEKSEPLSDDTLFEIYRQAMDECEEYPEAENSGVYVPVERIAPTFSALIAEHLEALAS